MKKSIAIVILLLVACCLLSSCDKMHYDRNVLSENVVEIRLIDCQNTADGNHIDENSVKVLYTLPSHQIEQLIDKIVDIRITSNELMAATQEHANGVCIVLMYKNGSCDLISLNGSISRLTKDSTQLHRVGWTNLTGMNLTADLVMEYFVADAP